MSPKWILISSNILCLHCQNLDQTSTKTPQLDLKSKTSTLSLLYPKSSENYFSLKLQTLGALIQSQAHLPNHILLSFYLRPTILHVFLQAVPFPWKTSLFFLCLRSQFKWHFFTEAHNSCYLNLSSLEKNVLITLLEF